MNFLQYKIVGAPKKFKNQPRPLVSPNSVNFSQNFKNLSRETVPLKIKGEKALGGFKIEFTILNTYVQGTREILQS